MDIIPAWPPQLPVTKFGTSQFSSPEQCFHNFFSVPRIGKPLIYSLKLVNKLKGKKTNKNSRAFESIEKLILLSEGPSKGEELRKIHIFPENRFSSSGKAV